MVLLSRLLFLISFCSVSQVSVYSLPPLHMKRSWPEVIPELELIIQGDNKTVWIVNN